MSRRRPLRRRERITLLGIALGSLVTAVTAATTTAVVNVLLR
ncbi:hypothetical protein [Streptomyces sp. NPDC047928]